MTDDFCDCWTVYLCILRGFVFRLVVLGLFLLRRNEEAKSRQSPESSYVHAACVFGIGQVKGMAKFAAIHFGVRSPGFLCIAAFLLEHVGWRRTSASDVRRRTCP